MSRNILFISEQHLKDSSFISDNIDPKKLLPTIKAAQDLEIHKLLGTALYTKLQDMVEAGTISGDYKTLLDNYITDTLIWYTLAELVVVLQYEHVNKGVVQRTGETQQTLDFSTTQSIINHHKNRADWYAQRSIDYLCANNQLFPEYRNQNGRSDALHPDKTQYESSIYLGPIYRGRSDSFEDRYQGSKT